MTRKRSRWENKSRMENSVSEAARSASGAFCVDGSDESVLEKKTREVSSIGWNTMRAAREPVGRDGQYNESNMYPQNVP